MSAWVGEEFEPGELTCQELAEIITDYFAGALAVADRKRFEEHLAECENCARYVEQLRVTVEITGRVTAESIAPGVRTELLEVFRGWAARYRPR
jgi:anti-sigma factor RsiW